MDVTNPLPSWVTLLIVVGIFIWNLYLKRRASEEGLTRHHIQVSVGETILAGNLLVLCINVFYLIAFGRLRLPSGLLEAPDPMLAVALSLLALLLIFFGMGSKRTVETRGVVE